MVRLGPTGEDGHGAFRLRPRRGETRVWGADAARPVASGHGFSSDGLSSAGARRARAMKGVHAGARWCIPVGAPLAAVPHACEALRRAPRPKGSRLQLHFTGASTPPPIASVPLAAHSSTSPRPSVAGTWLAPHTRTNRKLLEFNLPFHPFRCRPERGGRTGHAAA
ncbi:hypothetical protein ACCO45_005459 [Purpureocillium lilacinum]|uniref:Uncharacterized protein n=1 Tax=Purpureocillium lilacinum TaxID=33203 RepID=A0ACC4DW78_PURLI